MKSTTPTMSRALVSRHRATTNAAWAAADKAVLNFDIDLKALQATLVEASGQKLLAGDFESGIVGLLAARAADELRVRRMEASLPPEVLEPLRCGCGHTRERHCDKVLAGACSVEGCICGKYCFNKKA